MFVYEYSKKLHKRLPHSIKNEVYFNCYPQRFLVSNKSQIDWNIFSNRLECDTATSLPKD